MTKPRKLKGYTSTKRVRKGEFRAPTGEMLPDIIDLEAIRGTYSAQHYRDQMIASEYLQDTKANVAVMDKDDLLIRLNDSRQSAGLMSLPLNLRKDYPESLLRAAQKRALLAHTRDLLTSCAGCGAKYFKDDSWFYSGAGRGALKRSYCSSVCLTDHCGDIRYHDLVRLEAPKKEFDERAEESRLMKVSLDQFLASIHESELIRAAKEKKTTPLFNPSTLTPELIEALRQIMDNAPIMRPSEDVGLTPSPSERRTERYRNLLSDRLEPPRSMRAEGNQLRAQVAAALRAGLGDPNEILETVRGVEETLEDRQRTRREGRESHDDSMGVWPVTEE